MSAQAFIFDLSLFEDLHADDTACAATGLEAGRLFNQAVEHGLPCALISELPYRLAEQQLRRRFGDTAHHIFSVVLTGADFGARGHKSPYAVVLHQLGMPPDDVLAVTASPSAMNAARSARINVQPSRKPDSVPVRYRRSRARLGARS